MNCKDTMDAAVTAAKTAFDGLDSDARTSATFIHLVDKYQEALMFDGMGNQPQTADKTEGHPV